MSGQCRYNFWGLPLKESDFGYDEPVSIDCKCGRLVKREMRTNQYNCSSCQRKYFIGEDKQIHEMKETC